MSDQFAIFELFLIEFHTHPISFSEFATTWSASNQKDLKKRWEYKVVIIKQSLTL
jgi:hypothetical protein